MWTRIRQVLLGPIEKIDLVQLEKKIVELERTLIIKEADLRTRS